MYLPAEAQRAPERNRVSRTAIGMIRQIAEEKGVTGRQKLFQTVCDVLEDLWPEDRWEEYAVRAGLDTTGKIHSAIDAYLRQSSCPGSVENRAVSEGAMHLIHSTAQKLHSTDRRQLLRAVAAHLEQQFKGDALEYHLQQMHLQTTGDILYAIDLYNIARRYHVFQDPA